KKKYTLNFSLLPLLLTFGIALINFLRIDQVMVLYIMYTLLIIMLFIFLNLMYKIIENYRNRESVQLEELYYVLSELHLLILHSEKK
ncbi:hypothetical protein OKS35_14215, partial [Exiguobacterium sp. N5]|uniref:hypothetical protein n=1 Tax=Exiguobacterium sp. N5 TaxID=2990450 RepID=UPI0021F438E6